MDENDDDNVDEFTCRRNLPVEIVKDNLKALEFSRLWTEAHRNKISKFWTMATEDEMYAYFHIYEIRNKSSEEINVWKRYILYGKK